MIRITGNPPAAAQATVSSQPYTTLDDTLSRSGSRRLYSPPSAGSKRLRNVLVLVWLVVAAVTLYAGIGYYVVPLPERPFAALHELFKPSGLIGHGYGVVGSLMMVVGVSMYSLRKRIPLLSRLGRLRGWLQVHIFLCTLGPFLVVLHTSFKFGGIVSIALWSMLIVVASGVFGRYVYARIPKTIHGQFMSMRAIESDRESLMRSIEKRAGLSRAELVALRGSARSVEPRGFLHALYVAGRNDLRSRGLRRRIDRRLGANGVPEGVRLRLGNLIRDEIQLEQQVILLKPFQRLFRWWHILHIPLAIVMFVIMIVHVVVAALFGYVWVL